VRLINLKPGIKNERTIGRPCLSNVITSYLRGRRSKK
jgi:hypothetical protein